MICSKCNRLITDKNPEQLFGCFRCSLDELLQDDYYCSDCNLTEEDCIHVEHSIHQDG